MFELIGVLEVAVRNAMYRAPQDLAIRPQGTQTWYRDSALFKGNQGGESLNGHGVLYHRCKGTDLTKRANAPAR